MHAKKTWAKENHIYSTATVKADPLFPIYILVIDSYNTYEQSNKCRTSDERDMGFARDQARFNMASLQAHQDRPGITWGNTIKAVLSKYILAYPWSAILLLELLHHDLYFCDECKLSICMCSDITLELHTLPSPSHIIILVYINPSCW